MKVLAIDQSYASSGIVVLDENGDIDFAERYVSDNNDDYYSRAWEVATHIAEVADDYKPSVVVLEGLAFGAMGNQTRNLAGLLFVITCLMRYTKGYQVEIVTAGAVKKFATGSGKATKVEMVENLPAHVLEYFKALGVKKTTGLTDLTDGYWIGRFYQENFSKSKNKKNKDLDEDIEE